MKTDLMFSSKTDQWATPQDFFDCLDTEFHFDLDPCADEYNHKCEKYFTKNDDGLAQNWGGAGSSVIRPMEKKSEDGSRNRMRKGTKKKHLCAC